MFVSVYLSYLSVIPLDGSAASNTEQFGPGADILERTSAFRLSLPSLFPVLSGGLGLDRTMETGNSYSNFFRSDPI